MTIKNESYLNRILILCVLISTIGYIAVSISSEGDNKIIVGNNSILPESLSVPVNNTVTNIIPTPSVYLTVQGGIGNQLFQYACSYSLARKYNLPLFVLVPDQANAAVNRSFAVNERPFGLDYFKLGNQTTLVDGSWNFSSTIRSLKDPDILTGSFYSTNDTLKPSDFCQSESFFSPYRDEILAAFQFTNLDLILTPTVLRWKNNIEAVPNRASVAIHIRRGDFNEMIRVPVAFYKNAIHQIVELLSPVKPTFFVFTDEKDLRILTTDFPFLFESNFTVHAVSNSNETNSIQELYLMKSCKNQIIPNSSFGWWAAYLNTNPGKIVIAAHSNPRWFEKIYEKPNDKIYYKLQYRYFYYPLNWLAMDAFNETVFL